jgi:type I restriction enzyme, R subunit
VRGAAGGDWGDVNKWARRGWQYGCDADALYLSAGALMAKNEAETRYELIDPVLRAKGYRVPYIRLETPAPVEPIGPKGRRRNGPGKTDYLLCIEVPNAPKPLPVAILEAKKEDEDPLKGMQQAKGYSECERFDAKFVFSTNGHRYGEFSKFTGQQIGPFPFADFPDHPLLTDRYHRDTGIKLDDPSASLLFQPDSPAYPESRYYQDATIRAAFEKIIQCEAKGEPARILLSLATGAGKTVIAANLLWRLNEDGRLPKPALFLCDRDELRGQAYSKLKAVFGDNARIVRTERGGNSAKNARVHIATYQTLGLDDEDSDFASFLSEHYPEDAFSVIVTSAIAPRGASGPRCLGGIPRPSISALPQRRASFATRRARRRKTPKSRQTIADISVNPFTSTR